MNKKKNNTTEYKILFIRDNKAFIDQEGSYFKVAYLDTSKYLKKQKRRND